MKGQSLDNEQLSKLREKANSVTYIEQQISTVIGTSKAIWNNATKLIFLLINHAESNRRDVSLMQKYLNDLKEADSHKTLLTCSITALKDCFGLKAELQDDGKYKCSVNKDLRKKIEDNGEITKSVAKLCEIGLQHWKPEPIKRDKDDKPQKSILDIYANEMVDGITKLKSSPIYREEALEIEDEWIALKARLMQRLQVAGFAADAARWSKMEASHLAKVAKIQSANQESEETEETKKAVNQ